MLAIKSGAGRARMIGLKPEALLGIMITHSVFEAHKQNCVLTSGIEGPHGRGSLHFAGMAFDVRSRDMLTSERIAIEKDLKASLGDDFDVILEGNHWHIEFQPKEPYS